MSKEKKITIILGVIITIVLFAAIGITYAWFSASVEGNDEAKTMVVKIAKLELTLNDTNILSIENGLPGASASKTFTVKNTGDVVTEYDIAIVDVSTTFTGSDLVYTLTSDNGGGTKTETVLPNTDETLVAHVVIDKNVTQTYTLTVTFKETYENQNANMGKTYSGKIQIFSRAATVNLSGYVTDMDGNPLINKIVEAHSDPVTTTTDENGYYEFQNIPAGEHTLTIKDEITGEELGTTQVTVASSLTTEIKNENELLIEKEPTKYVNLSVQPNKKIAVSLGTATLILAETRGNIYYGGAAKEITINGEKYGRLTCTTSYRGKATCSISGNKLIITAGSTYGEGTITVRESRTNQTIRYNFTNLETSINLSTNSGTAYIGGNSATATISGTNMGELYCGTTNDQIATCSIANNTLNITGVGEGQATITVREGNGNKTETYEVTTEYFGNIVTLDNQSATTAGTTSVTAIYNSAMPNITAPTKTGYTFGGYYTSTNGAGTQYYNSAAASAKNWDKTVATTLYVKWTANTYTLNLTKGTGVSTITVTGCTGSGTSYTCTYGTNVTVTATASSGYTINSTLTGTNIANKTNATAFVMPVPTSGTSGTSVTLAASATAKTYTLNLTKGTGVASVTATGCTTVTSGSQYTCTYNASVKVTATASSGYTISTTLTGTNISNKTNNTAFNMPVPTSGTSVTLAASATINTYTLNLTKGTGVASVTATGCTTVTAGSKYTCAYNASVKVTATASSGYTISTTLTGTYISNKTNGVAFNMPVPTSGTAVTLASSATKIQYYSCSWEPAALSGRTYTGDSYTSLSSACDSVANRVYDAGVYFGAPSPSASCSPCTNCTTPRCDCSFCIYDGSECDYETAWCDLK